jgi:long-chain fatty acid transport protein
MKFKQSMVSWSVAGALLAMSGSAAASGFALIEQSASGLGNAYAGGAASAEDASTVFFNPAGMSRLSGKQVVVAGHAITPSAKFSNNGSTAATAQTLGGTGGDAGGLAFVPNAYFVMEVNPAMRVGLGINAPFGLQTEYDSNWMGRFQAIKSKIETINLNPSVSYNVNEKFSFGAGLNYQHIKAELTSMKSLGAAGQGLSTLSGSDDAWGYNLGALFSMGTNARIGVSYRSAISSQLSGDAFVSNPSVVVIPGTNVTIPIKADMKTPDTLSLSYFRNLENSWDVMADLTHTGWSNFKELRVNQASSGSTISLTPENWKDTWRASIGASHHYNEQWSARAGIAVDQSPVPDSSRTARIPDNDRTWLSVGGQYKPTKSNAIDFGYAHLFVKDSSISNNTGSAGTPSTPSVGNLVGTYKNSVDILSAQYTHNF